MRVSLFADFKEEQWPSMERYAQGLFGALESLNELLPAKVLRPPFWRVLDKGKTLMRGVPLLRFWGNDLFLNRYVNYPLFATFNQSEVNHILDHSYSHLLSFVNSKRTVVTCHDLIPLKLHNPNLPQNKYLRLFESTVRKMNKAAFVIADSMATKKDLMELLKINSEKIVVIYPGLDKKFIPINDFQLLNRARLKWNLKKEIIYLLHVGVNHPYKNVEVVFRVLKLLQDQGLQVNLIKAGQDFTDQQKKMIENWHLAGSILFLKSIGDDDLIALYNLSTMLVYPSFVEGFGWPVLEALSCGLPVVCSREGSLPEVGGDEVFYANPKDPHDVAHQIKEVLRFCQGNEFVGKKRHWQNWANQFSWQKTAQKTYQVYEKVLGLLR